MNAATLIDVLPYLEALTGDTLEQNLTSHPDAMEELVASFEPDDPADSWEHRIEPLLRMLRRHGAPAMVDAIVRLDRYCCDLFTLEQLLIHGEQQRNLQLYHAQMTWLATAQLNAILGGEPFDVPDATAATEGRKA